MGGRSSKVDPQPDGHAVDQLARNLKELTINAFVGDQSTKIRDHWIELHNAVDAYIKEDGQARVSDLRQKVDAGENISTLLEKTRETIVSDIIAIFSGFLLKEGKPSLSQDERDRITCSIIYALQAPPKIFQAPSKMVLGAHERVLGGAWGIAKEKPIQCVALALLIVGIFFILYFWLGASTIKTATTRTAGTLVGCGLSTAALVTVGVAWMVSEA